MVQLVDRVPRLQRAFVYPLVDNPNVPNVVKKCLGIFIYDLNTKISYYLNICHNDAVSNDIDLSVIANYTEIYCIDKKLMLHLGFTGNLLDITFTFTLKLTELHSIYTKDYEYNTLLNQLIPLVHHISHFENFVKDIDFSLPINYFYNDKVTNVFYQLEKNSFTYTGKTESKFPLITYNLANQNGRPTAVSYNMNLHSLPNDSDVKKKLIASGNYLIHVDFTSFILRLFSILTKVHVEEKDIYTHLVKELGLKSRSDVKSLAFKIIFGDGDSYNSELLTAIKNFKKNLIEEYKEKGFILSPVSQRKIYPTSNENSLLPIFCQILETEIMTSKMLKILKYLEQKKTKAVFYHYDAVIFDFFMEDGKETIEVVKEIMQEKGFFVKLTAKKSWYELSNHE